MQQRLLVEFSCDLHNDIHLWNLLLVSLLVFVTSDCHNKMWISNWNILRRTTTWTLLYCLNIMRNCHQTKKEIGHIICGWRSSVFGLCSWEYKLKQRYCYNWYLIFYRWLLHRQHVLGSVHFHFHLSTIPYYILIYNQLVPYVIRIINNKLSFILFSLLLLFSIYL